MTHLATPLDTATGDTRNRVRKYEAPVHYITKQRKFYDDYDYLRTRTSFFCLQPKKTSSVARNNDLFGMFGRYGCVWYAVFDAGIVVVVISSRRVCLMYLDFEDGRKF